MALVAAEHEHDSAIQVTAETTGKLFLLDKKYHIKRPWANYYQGEARQARRECTDVITFLELFPSVGTTYGEQAAIQKRLDGRLNQSKLIEESLASKYIVTSWESLGKNLNEIKKDIKEAIVEMTPVLAANNMPIAEQNSMRRRPEFEALQTLLMQAKTREHLSIRQLMTDGEYYIGSDEKGGFLQKPMQQIWKDTVITFLKAQYLMAAPVNAESAKLKKHMEAIEKLSAGALYAYATVLSIAYELPGATSSEDRRRAVNALVWIDEWADFFEKEKKADRSRIVVH